MTLPSAGDAMVDRLPPIPPERMTEAQTQAAAQFEAVRKQAVFGPFTPLLRSPELMRLASDLGEYLRYRNSLPRQLSELAILLTARRWTQQYEWYIHEPDARASGLGDEVIAEVAAGRRPETMTEAQAIVYDFCTELATRNEVTDSTYARAVARFGEQGIVDLVGVNGYYTLIAMILNVARTPVPPGHAPAPRPLPK